MSTNHDKYLVLRGKNKNIYFIQKRVSKKISSIIGKDFIKKSLETEDIHIAREKRDAILEELNEIEKNATKDDIKAQNNVPISGELNLSNEYIKDITKTHTENVPIDIKEENHEYKIENLRSKKRNREAILQKIDNLTPIGIIILIILVLFIK
tara:strand:+ start:590 stop:1048 length:459 start_codon:yes stop_codon:yes gene_type:complete